MLVMVLFVAETANADAEPDLAVMFRSRFRLSMVALSRVLKRPQLEAHVKVPLIV